MTTKEERLITRLAKAQAKQKKCERQVQALNAQLSKQKRNADTHRKILEGVTALYGCAHSEEYRRLHEQFRHRALTLEKDRMLFGLPVLQAQMEGDNYAANTAMNGGSEMTVESSNPPPKRHDAAAPAALLMGCAGPPHIQDIAVVGVLETEEA